MINQISASRTAAQEIDAIMEQADVFASACSLVGGPFDNGSGLEMAECERANLRALLSKLRAPVADERGRRDTIAEVVGLCNRIPGSTTWNAAEFMYDEMNRRAALASAPALDLETAEVNFLVRVLETLDTWRAEEWNELLERRPAILALLRPMVLASAPVAGEPSEDEQAVDSPIKAAYVEHFGHAAGWLSYKGSWFIEGFKAAQKSAPVAGEAQPVELRGVAETIKDGDGFWRSCSGCHELNEGRDTGPYSAVLQCHLGNGCSECGGIGAIWDSTDYQAMADAMARDMGQSANAAPQASEADKPTRDQLEAMAFGSTNKPNGLYRHWWRKGYDAALSEQPAAQKEQSDA